MWRQRRERYYTPRVIYVAHYTVAVVNRYQHGDTGPSGEDEQSVGETKFRQGVGGGGWGRGCGGGGVMKKMLERP